MTTKTKKPLFVVTYVIALVCLLLGLLLPLYDGKMLVTQLYTALKEILGQDVNFSGTLDVNFFGLFTLDIGALAVLLYAVITVVGVFLLIPVLAGKKGKAATVCPVIVEVAAAVVLFIAIFNSIGSSAIEPGIFYPRLALVIAAGGTVLMLIIQQIAKYKSSGVAKLIMVILGLIGVAALLDLTVLSFYKAEYGSINGLFAVSETGVVYSGYDIINVFIQKAFCTDAAVSSASIIGYIANATTEMLGTSTAAVLAFYFASAAIIVVIFNFIADLISLGCKSTKGGLIFDVIRYVVAAVAAVVAMILLFIAQNTATPGLLLYVITAISVIAAIVSIVRAAVYKPAKKEDECVEPEEESIDEAVEEPAQPEAIPAQATGDYTYVPVYPAAAPAPEPAPALVYTPSPATTPVVEQQVIYKVKEVYGGPTDSFISRLAESEKIEFAKLFIEKINGPYENIPDYVVGGDNKDFFASLFVYLGRFRPKLSDGLMNKIYSELNLLN